jgi:hypothetical protein
MRASAMRPATAAALALTVIAGGSAASAPPPGRIAVARVQGVGQITLWRSADGRVVAAIPTSAIRFGPGPSGWGLVRGSTVSHGGGVDTPPVTATYHDAASLASAATGALFGIAPRTRRAAFSAGRAAARPRWVALAMQYEREAPTQVDDWATDTAGFSRAHPGAWWVGAAAFGARLSDLQWYRTSRQVGGGPLDPPEVALQALYTDETAVTTTRSQQLAELPGGATWQPTVGGRHVACSYFTAPTPAAVTCVVREGATIIRIEAVDKSKSEWLRALGQLAQMH